jgi:galactokinase
LALRFPGIRALRDVSQEAFQKAEGSLPEPIRRRCRHVVSENIRTLEAARVLSEGNLSRFGELMTASHVSLRDDYKVSSEYLDLLVKTALDGQECLGSRLTGAGFGGCTVSLVRSDGVPVFRERLTRVYREKTDLVPEIYVSRACRGAEAGESNLESKRYREFQSG